MAKEVKIPTYEYMQEFIKSFREDPIHNNINDLEHAVIRKEMTRRMFALELPDEVKPMVWKFCKTLVNYAHAPVTPSDYKRMEKWIGEEALINVLLQACDNYFPDPSFKYHFDTIGFSYSIALLSQSQYRREDCLALLGRITDYYVKTKDDWYTVLLRNMKVLSKSYPDLAQFKAELDKIEGNL